MLRTVGKAVLILLLAAWLIVAGWYARGMHGEGALAWPPVLHWRQPPDPEPPAFEPLPGPEPGEARIIFVGDVLPLEDRDYLTLAAPLLRAADYVVCNLECPLSTHGARTPLKYNERGHIIRNEFFFTCAPAHAPRLAAAGFDAATLANNHIMDYGGEALLETLGVLDTAGIAHTGAGRDRNDARQPVIAEVQGQTLALLAYVCADTLPGTEHFAATDFAAGTVFVDGGADGQPTELSRQMLVNDIAAARQRADFVVPCLHWGTEARDRPDPLPRALGRLCIDAGADLVIGHHPHVLQGIELYRGRPIVYSLGNFIFPTKWECNHFSAALELRLRNAQWCELVLHPVRLKERAGDPAPATGADLQRIVKRITDLSREFGTESEFVQDDGPPRVVIRNPAPPPPRQGLLRAEARHFYAEPTAELSGMMTVHFLAWDIEGERRLARERTVVVCAELADEVLDIFREIYSDEERFPIHDLVGYNYRTIAGDSGSGLSNHAFGRAIDINRAENPMIENGRKIVHPDEPPYTPGAWRPGEDPFSITADGSVVRAFKSRGWRWGGDWTSCRDYQHFDKPYARS